MNSTKTNAKARAKKKKRGTAYNMQDQELIHQLMQSRLAQKEELVYEDLDSYEVPPRTQFSMLTKPAVSIKYKQFTFSMASIRLFEGIKHILPILSADRKRLAIIPLAEEESVSVEWARQKSDGTWTNKGITSLEFVEKIFTLMDWQRDCRYKALGYVANSPRGIILVFDLSEAIMFSRETVEFVNPETGEVKKKKVIYYPDEYKGRIGKSYNDYMETHKTSIFDQFEDLTGNTYNDASPLSNEPTSNQSGGLIEKNDRK